MSIERNVFPIFTNIGGYHSELKGISLQRYTQNDFSTAKTGTLFFDETDKRIYVKKNTYGSIDQSNTIAYLSDIQNSGGGGSSAPIPQKTLFVSPNFNNTNKHYSNVINAYNNASSGDTIVIYSGSYPFPNWVDKNITFNCVGDVILTADYVVNIRDSKCTIIGNVDIKFGNENGSNSSTGQHLILHRSFFVVKCNLFVAYCIFQQHNSIVIIDADIFYSNIEFTQSNYPMYLELTARRIGNGMSTSQYAPHIANPYFIFRDCNSNSHARIMGLNNNSILKYYGNNINGLDINKVNLSYTNSANYGSLPPY